MVGGLDGNALELERLVDQILLAPEADIPVPGTRLSGAVPSGARPSQRSPPKSYRAPHEVSDQELVSALKAHRWNVKKTARELGISRASLYVMIDRCPTVRRASDLTPQELRDCHQRHQGDLDAMADELEVSRYALQHRLRQLDDKEQTRGN